MRAWWRGREPRERQTLALGVAALACAAGYLFVVEPAMQAFDARTRQVEELRATQAWMRGAAAEAAMLRGRVPATGRGGVSLLDVVNDGLSEAGLQPAVQRLQPEGEHSVRVTMQKAPLDAVLRWLQTLVRAQGVRVTDAAIERSGEGLASVRITLEGRAE